MPRMVKPELPSRPAPDRAAEKRAGLVGTLTPGSNRIRSLMSVTRLFSMVSAVMTLTLAGTLGAGADHGDRGDRDGLFQVRDLLGEGGEGGCRKGGQPGGEHQKRAHGYGPGWRGVRNYCERLSESTSIVARR